MTTNVGLLKILKSAPKARFYLCDLHVHSPASADVRLGDRFSQLSEPERQLMEKIPEAAANDPVSYEKQVLSAFPVSRYHELLVERRDAVARQESISAGEDWAFVAITDHNVCDYAAALSMHAWERREESRLVVFPGLELDVVFPMGGAGKADAHVLLIFSPGTQSSDIRVAVRDATKVNWEFGQKAEVSSLSDFIAGLRDHKDYPAVAIAAHVASGKGVRSAAKRVREGETFSALEAAIARTSAEIEKNPDADKDALNQLLDRLKKERSEEAELVSLDVLGLIGSCGFDGLQVSCKQDESHYRRLHRFKVSFGRAVPLVASDAHRVGDVFACENNIPYLKLPTLALKANNDQILHIARHAIRYGETRFSYSTPGQVTRWISGLEITPDAKTASEFWPFSAAAGRKSFVLPLSRNLNCLVGGRGSGKSAAIEAIAFVTRPEDFDAKPRKGDEPEDWYKRAKATLAGCHVRLVWQIAGSTSDLPKGAVFSSRYFNPTGDHAPVSHTNAEDKEILGSSNPHEPPQIFRTRQIENAAAPAELRRLFDALVGERIPVLEKEIAGLISQLEEQRKDMEAVAWRVHELTERDSPLQEYGRRKAAYEAANSSEVQPFYKYLDDAGVADGLARDAQTRWGRAVDDTEVEKIKSKLLLTLEAVSKKIIDKNGKLRPYCESLAKLGQKGKDGFTPRERLEQAADRVAEEITAVGAMLGDAVTSTAAELKSAREILVEKGLPAGSQDREAKKQDFKKAEEDLDEYRELTQTWQERVQARRQKFHELVEKCKQRTQLRVETANRLCAQLGQDLDPSVLVIKVEVHAMEDRDSFREWLCDHIGGSIARSRDERIDALIGKGVMPDQVRDSLLGEAKDAVDVFAVAKGKASDGRIEPELAAKIVQECSGRARLEPEHTTMKDAPSSEFIKKLPAEIRDGLWTFPVSRTNEEELLVDGVLALDAVMFDDRPEILLNDRPSESGSRLRPVGELSPGQRCSAILPILLLNGRSPLIIDQPEDNLDNRLIRQVIVNILASIKLRRQVIIATHNPNLPVLGDVEQAVVLRAIEEKQAHVESTGDLDTSDTVAHLTEIMEGGREAFQYRQSIYQAHWSGPVAPA